MSEYRLFAFDLDGTLTQHRCQLEAENRHLLDRIRTFADVVIVGGNRVQAILEQTDRYPADILGNYGMECAYYDRQAGVHRPQHPVSVPVDAEQAARQIRRFREWTGMTDYTGDSYILHPSGIITIPMLGLEASLEEKLRFDPLRTQRQIWLPVLQEFFPERDVLISGTTSFDLVPRPYSKLYALTTYCSQRAIALKKVLFFGDDWRPGGNDESVYRSGIAFVPVPHYTRLTAAFEHALADTGILN